MATARKQEQKPRETERREEQIRQRAYERYLERGAQPGLELDDWVHAEKELSMREKRQEEDK